MFFVVVVVVVKDVVIQNDKNEINERTHTT